MVTLPVMHSPALTSPASPPDAALLDAYSQAVITAARRVSPSVVKIEPASRDGRSLGAGSGLVITPDGFVLTNSHVVSGGARFELTASDGARRAAHLVGDDPATDLALLRLHDADLPSVGIGDAPALQVGQLV